MKTTGREAGKVRMRKIDESYAKIWQKLFDGLDADEQALILASPSGKASVDLAAKASAVRNDREFGTNLAKKS